MKIIGKLHDYYDGLLAYGQDDSLIFKRETTSFDSHNNPDLINEVEKLLSIESFKRGYWRDYISFPVGRLRSGDGATFTANTVFVGFCGKMYMGFVIEPDSGNWLNRRTQMAHTTKHAYSVYDSKKLEDNYNMFSASGRMENIPWLTNMLMHHKDANKIDPTQFMIKHKVPYFVVTTNNGQVSMVDFVPELKRYEFQKVKDPYSAYQEISMFVGGVLPRQTPDMATVSDKDRIAQYGFNELSFRHPFKIKKVKK